MKGKTNKDLTKKDLEYLRKIAESSGKKIDESGVFLAFGSKDYHKDPVALIQFALALFMDKPIGFLAIEGATIPHNIRKIAEIEMCDGTQKSIEAATKRLLEKFDLN